MRRCQEAGLTLGRENIWAITYTDDGTLLAASAAGLQEIVERFKRYVEKKGLRIHIEKSKGMRYRKESRRWKEMEIKWRGEKVEEIREFSFLGYMMSRKNGDIVHVEYLARKAKSILGKV